MYARMACALSMLVYLSGVGNGAVLARNFDANEISVRELLVQISETRQAIQETESTIERLSGSLARIESAMRRLIRSKADGAKEVLVIIDQRQMDLLRAQAERVQHQIDNESDQLDRLRNTERRLVALLESMIKSAVNASPNPDRV